MVNKTEVDFSGRTHPVLRTVQLAEHIRVPLLQDISVLYLRLHIGFIDDPIFIHYNQILHTHTQTKSGHVCRLLSHVTLEML